MKKSQYVFVSCNCTCLATLNNSGQSAKEPNAYPFGTSYEDIYTDLKTKVNAVFPFF